MKKIFIFLIAMPLIVFAQKKKAVFIIVDGIPFDVIQKLNTPAIDAIAAAGGMVQAYAGGEKDGYSQTPTISANGYTSVLTGTWVHKHNVWDNDIAAINYNYYNVFRVLKDASPKKKIAIFSTWLDNRTKLCGEGLPEAGNLHFDYAFDGLELDTIQFPHDNNADYIRKIDDTVSAVAAAYIEKEGPDLSWAYLEHTDDMGHKYGDSPQFYDAVQAADNRIKKIWDAIQARSRTTNEEWLIIVTTDHGRDAVTGNNHGGQSDRERASWIATNATHLNAQFSAGMASLADIMPTIAQWMQISIPKAQAMEIDGISLDGKLKAVQPAAEIRDSIITVQWKPLTKKGSAKIWLSSTNHFKKGGKDEYTLVATVPVKKGKATIDVHTIPSGMYKIVIEAGGQLLTRWVVTKHPE